MDRLEVFFNNLEKKLIHEVTGSYAPVSIEFEHPFFGMGFDSSVFIHGIGGESTSSLFWRYHYARRRIEPCDTLISIWFRTDKK